MGSGRLYFKTNGMELRKTEGIHINSSRNSYLLRACEMHRTVSRVFPYVLGLSAFNPPAQTIELHKDKVNYHLNK